MYENISIKLLNLKDSDLEITNIVVVGHTKEIYIQKILSPHHCPLCQNRMYSKGIYKRSVNHPVMQDGFRIKLIVSQRRWKCTNPNCEYIITDKFSFLKKYMHNTNVTELLIVEAFRDPNVTAAQVARKFNVSDTFAIRTFQRYVDMHRRTLTEAICIDEVKVDIYKNCKYALVIQDFITKEPIDILPSRRDEFTQSYFGGISLKERSNVKYLVSDMYAPYSAYIDKYFFNAVHIVDSFHVVKWINSKILVYINALARRQKYKDEERHEKLEQEFKRKIEFVPSNEYYLLKHFHWIVLANNENLDYQSPGRYNHKLRRYMDTAQYEHMLFDIAPELEKMRDLKEEYIRFNKRYLGRPNEAKVGLLQIIRTYRESDFKIFNEIADTLDSHFDAIINSFILIDINKEKIRLSNGPMESLNRIPKDMKRNARGFKNWDIFRNRFLFSMRKNASILGTPKSTKEVCFKIDRKRGSYSKSNPRLKNGHQLI